MTEPVLYLSPEAHRRWMAFQTGSEQEQARCLTALCDELDSWKVRALKAEDELFKLNYAVSKAVDTLEKLRGGR